MRFCPALYQSIIISTSNDSHVPMITDAQRQYTTVYSIQWQWQYTVYGSAALTLLNYISFFNPFPIIILVSTPSDKAASLTLIYSILPYPLPTVFLSTVIYRTDPYQRHARLHSLHLLAEADGRRAIGQAMQESEEEEEGLIFDLWTLSFDHWYPWIIFVFFLFPYRTFPIERAQRI